MQVRGVKWAGMLNLTAPSSLSPPLPSPFQVCPACRQGLLTPPVRNLPLEAAAMDLKLVVPCPFVVEGCHQTAMHYAEAGVHAEKCGWRKVRRLGLAQPGRGVRAVNVE